MRPVEGDEHLRALPDNLHLGYATPDGGCLFHSLSTLTICSEDWSSYYRDTAVTYVREHPDAFEDDIRSEADMSVAAWCDRMAHPNTYADRVAVAALALSQGFSITLFIEAAGTGVRSLTSERYVPVAASTASYCIHCDLNVQHYSPLIDAQVLGGGVGDQTLCAFLASLIESGYPVSDATHLLYHPIHFSSFLRLHYLSHAFPITFSSL